MILFEYSSKNIIYLELSDNKHHKFYELCTEKNIVIARYGRIGKKERFTIKNFNNNFDALKFFQKQIQQKFKRGYKVAIKGLTEPRTPKNYDKQLKIPFL